MYLFHEVFISSDWHLRKMLFAFIMNHMIQSVKKFAHITTVKLSWHLHNCEWHGLFFLMLEQCLFGLWDLDHELINNLWDGSLVPDSWSDSCQGNYQNLPMCLSSPGRPSIEPARVSFPFSRNPLCAKVFRENINIYSHFMWFLHIDMTQVVEILPQVRQRPTYST